MLSNTKDSNYHVVVLHLMIIYSSKSSKQDFCKRVNLPDSIYLLLNLSAWQQQHKISGFSKLLPS